MPLLPIVQNFDMKIEDDEEDDLIDSISFNEPIERPKPQHDKIFEQEQEEEEEEEEVKEEIKHEVKEEVKPEVKEEVKPEVKPEVKEDEIIYKKPRVKAEVYEEGYEEGNYIVVLCKNGRKRWFKKNYKENCRKLYKQNKLGEARVKKRTAHPIIQNNIDTTERLHKQQLEKLQEQNKINQKNLIQLIQSSNLSAIANYEKVRKERKAQKKKKQEEEQKKKKEQSNINLSNSRNLRPGDPNFWRVNNFGINNW